MTEERFFIWDPDKLSVDVQAMDDEHERLVRLMNDLYDRHVAGDASREELSRMLNELAAFTVQHFRNEEQHMASIEYPGLAKHKLIHADLLEKLSAKRQEFEDGDGTLPDSLFTFLKFWLNAHIKGIDIKYGQFVPSGTA